MQVCTQDNYKNLIVGENLDERLGWFVVDVLFVLAESLAVSKDSSLNLNPKKTMQLQAEIARSLVDLSMRVESVRKKTITRVCTQLLLDHPLRYLNAPSDQRTFQPVLQAMAFIACEYLDDLDETENQTTYNKLIGSKLVTECLK